LRLTIAEFKLFSVVLLVQVQCKAHLDIGHSLDCIAG